MSEVNQHLAQYQALIGVHFENSAWLLEALTHRSALNELPDLSRHNERLEFLGDAILDYVVADMLFQRFPHENEGGLSRLRSAMVKADSLAILARQLQIGEYLILGRGEELTGARTRINILCRGFEALVGAVYCDGGIDKTQVFLLPLLDGLLEDILAQNLQLDARSVLQERIQAELHVTPAYRMAEAVGAEHERSFMLEVLIGKHVIGRGAGVNKRLAAQAAAQDALDKVQALGGWDAETLKAAQEKLKRDKPRKP